MIHNINKHRVRNGDVMTGIDELMKSDKADIFYSDPPWGQGNLSYWQTINVRQNTGAQKSEVNHGLFIKNIFALAKEYAKNIVFIEYGQRWRDEIIALAQSYGLTSVGVIELLYASGSNKLKCDLHIFAKTPFDIQQEYIDSVYHTTGYKTLVAAVKPFVIPDGIILDPCCGMGYSAQAAVDNGMRFRGNELNKSRLEKTIKRLQ